MRATRAAPLAWAWGMLIGSACAVLAAGSIGTALLVTRAGQTAIPTAFFAWLAGACGLTIAGLAIRTFRWAFLLRRAGVRIPIRDATIGYCSGLSLLFAPLLTGEATVRAIVHAGRNGIPATTTCVVNVWERGLDLVAVGTLAVIAAAAVGRSFSATLSVPLLVLAASLSRPIREALLSMLVSMVNTVAHRVSQTVSPVEPAHVVGLTDLKVWCTAWGASLAAWALPGLGLWGLAGAWRPGLTVRAAEATYGSACFWSGLLFAPGGVFVMGDRVIRDLTILGFGPPEAALTALAIRIATAGVAVALGTGAVLAHLMSSRSTVEHFDAIAAHYHAEIPEARRQTLVARKTAMMARTLRAHAAGCQGLDVGCGQGWHAARMNELGFSVRGIDASRAQVDIARRNGAGAHLEHGSVLAVPAAAGTFDFVYAINVFHHLQSVDEQCRGFAELTRVLRPGGLLILHEMNARNILFRFYLGYLYPALRSIDEGTERWLLPDRLATYTALRLADVEYFTFLPDFLPGFLVRALRPLEVWLERSPIRTYAAHYMAVFEKARG